MTDGLDLDAYFRRIGYHGPREATLEVLRGIHGGQATSIPFENLDPLLGLGVRIDAESLQQKLVTAGRGGYCFELNGLLLGVLRALGFEVTPLLARVVWMAPAGAPLGARSHMVLRVRIDGELYLADVGFGGLTLPEPLRFLLDVAQTTSHEPYRLTALPPLVPGGNQELSLEALVSGVWRPLYRFDLQAQEPVDYEVANHYVATHRRSVFVNHLMVARPAPGHRYNVLNDTFTERGPDGAKTVQVLGSPEELRSLLLERFGVTFDAGGLAGLADHFARWRAAREALG